MNKKSVVVLLITTILHFLVDLICASKIINELVLNYSDNLILIYLIYNGIAFVGQIPFGFLMDKIDFKNKERIFIIISAVFIFIGGLAHNFIISCVFLGVANCIYHISGAKICGRIDSNKSINLGIFVSSGAFGLSIGTYLVVDKLIRLLIIFLFIVISFILYFIKEELNEKLDITINKTNLNFKLILLILFIILAVFIRSFLGKIMYFNFETKTIMLVSFGFFSFVGKAIGGLFRDKFGSLIVILISMSILIFSLLIGKNSYILFCLSIILVNISMPITLFELNRINKKFDGLNFGLLAATLFLGVSIGEAYLYNNISYIIIVIISCIISIISIYFVVRVNNDGIN